MKNFKLPAAIIAIGLVLAVLAHLLTSICRVPTVTEQDFPFSVTYKLDGETKTFEGVYTCRFDGLMNDGIDPLDRNYSGEYTVGGETTLSRGYTIANKDGYKLEIVTLFNDPYLMGDTKDESYQPTLDDPTLEVTDAEGYPYELSEIPGAFDVEIVSWDFPAPIENTFVFAGFSGPHSTSMVAMILVGFVTLILCLVLVKKDEGIVYDAFDKFSVVANFIVAFVALPFIAFVACMIQAFPTGPDWIYQLDLCLPAIVPFTLSASVSLRRKGCKISGFFIQFLGFALMLVLALLEYLL